MHRKSRALIYARVKIRVAINAPLISGNFIQALGYWPPWVAFRYEGIFRIFPWVTQFCIAELGGPVQETGWHTMVAGPEFLHGLRCHLFNHLIRALPNTNEYRNTTVIIQVHGQTEDSSNNSSDRPGGNGGRGYGREDSDSYDDDDGYEDPYDNRRYIDR
ncbi:hypothetical protein LIER_38171 [Lithospermum erythrorhizon]|uniref:Uncharacterized protein n=1 Tax=Lithospermum erythrorhizon TaxID=34254 RepID=A0AAV3PWI4_LITER